MRSQNATGLLLSGVNTENNTISLYYDLNCLLKRSRCSKQETQIDVRYSITQWECKTSKRSENRLSTNQKGVQKSLLIPPVFGLGWSKRQIVPLWVSKDCLGSRCGWALRAVTRLFLFWPLQSQWWRTLRHHVRGPKAPIDPGSYVMECFSIQFLFFKQNLKISCVQLTSAALRTFWTHEDTFQASTVTLSCC